MVDVRMGAETVPDWLSKSVHDAHSRYEIGTYVPDVVMVVVTGTVDKPDVDAEAFKQEVEAPAWIWKTVSTAPSSRTGSDR